MPTLVVGMRRFSYRSQHAHDKRGHGTLPSLLFDGNYFVAAPSPSCRSRAALAKIV